MAALIDVVTPAGVFRLNRDRLATAILLRLDGMSPGDTCRKLETEHGVEHYEAMRLTVATRYCIEQGIEP